jgi:hypothetical protein
MSWNTNRATVHMVLGGGGTSVPSNQLFFTPPQCRVITAVGAPDPTPGKRPPVFVTDPAPWAQCATRHTRTGSLPSRLTREAAGTGRRR